MKLLIVTDAWFPQVNGVVRTLDQMRAGLQERGWAVEVLGPGGITLPCPTYAEIRLSLEPSRLLRETMSNWRPTAVHIATEGPLGAAARHYCLTRELPFTTSFHTRFPEYLKMRFGLPRRWTYSYLRAFHRPAQKLLVPSRSIMQELQGRGFTNVELWGRGVDVELFDPCLRKSLPYAGPLQLYVGRLAKEKNVEEFLQLKNPGTKLVVGDGPERARLQRQFPSAVFTGPLFGEKLAEVYASADVFVFPSATDTFGLVLLEALASGLPVAAYRSPGPVDVITDNKIGVLSEPGELGAAVEQALLLERANCRQHALANSWAKSLTQFERALVSFDRPAGGDGLDSFFGSQVALDI